MALKNAPSAGKGEKLAIPAQQAEAPVDNQEVQQQAAKTREKLAFLESEELELSDLKETVEALKDGEKLPEAIKAAGTVPLESPQQLTDFAAYAAKLDMSDNSFTNQMASMAAMATFDA